MKTFACSFLPALALCAVSAVSLHAGSTDRAALVSRGRYLVENVGTCADCHSPRNERGEFLTDQMYKGSPLAFAPTVPMPFWATVAPQIAGLPTMTEEQAVSFLKTGLRPGNVPVRPPMPPFRFNDEDARAVAAYLKSLAP